MRRPKDAPPPRPGNVCSTSSVYTGGTRPLSDHELASLLERARAREPEALAELCERVYPRVLKYMRYRVRAAHAEDLTEEVFLRLVRSIDRQSGSFQAWLHRVASNVVADWIRRKKVRERVRTDPGLLPQRPREDNPADGVARRLDVADALAQLTDAQRELVTLKFMQGLSNADIAEATGRTPGAVRILQFRALSVLRRLLSSEEPDHGLPG